MIRTACLVLGLLVAVEVAAQNPFRSRQTGDWNQSSTWEEFVAGSWQLTLNTPNATSGTITIQSPHVVTVTAAENLDETTVQSGGSLVINNAIDLTVNNGAGTDLTIAGLIGFLGEGFISGTGTLSVTATGFVESGSLNATGALDAGTTVGNIRTSGTRTFATGSRVTYNGTAAQIIGSGHPGNAGGTAVVSEINNPAGVSFDQNAGSNFGGGGSIYFPGDLILTQGNLNIISVVGVTRTLVLTAGVTENGNFITLAGPAVNLLISGSGNLVFPSPAGLQDVGNLTIVRPANTVTFVSGFRAGTRISVSGNAVFNGSGNSTRDLILTSGSIDFNGSMTITGSTLVSNGTLISFEGTSLSMAGDYQSGGGLLQSDATSTFSMTGAFPLTSPLTFAGGSALSTFTLQKVNIGISAVIDAPVNIVNTLTLSSGQLSIVGSVLSLSSGATISKAGLGSIVTSSPSGGPWNLIYTGVSQSTGLEIPPSGILASLTLNTNSSTTVTLTQDVTVNNAISIPSNSRVLACGTFNVAAGSISNTGTISAPSNAASTGLTVSGNFVNNGVYTHNNGVLIISGASVFSGTQINTTNFNTINISASGTLTAPTTLNIRADFANAGSFVSGAGTVVFNGAVSTLSGATMSTTSFANVTVNNGATLVPASNFILTGNLVMNGSFTAGAGTTTFNGVSALSGTNINTTLFNAVTVNATRTLTASNITLGITGNLTIDGTFNAGTTGTLLCAGTSVLSGTTIASTNFVHVTINNSASATGPSNLNVQGNFTNNGTFTASGGTVSFTGGTGGRTLSGTSNTQFFNLVMNKTNGGTSLTVSSAQTVTNALTLTDGILDNPSSNLSVSSGGSVTKSSNAAISTAALNGGPFSLIYVGATQSTTLEIPVSATVSNLTINVNNGATVTLSASLTVQNTISIPSSGRTLSAAANNLTTVTLNNSGTFSAPTAAASTGFTITGNLVNNGTFTHNSGTTLFTGNTTLSGSSQANLGRVTITGTLNASVSFGVAGHFTNNGTFTATGVTALFNGVTLQNISGSAPVTTFHNLSITNTVGPTSVSIETTVNLVNILTLGNNSKLDADGSAGTSVLTLLSTNDSPAADASIALLPATAQVNGNVTVQRFFRPADNFDRFISSPVSNGPVSQIQASLPAGSFPVTGGFTGTSFPCTGCVNDGHNLRFYKESVPGIINAGYTGWILSNTNTLVPGVGYDAYMWNGVSNTTVSFRGTINRGSIALGVVTGPFANSITHTNNGTASADGWNLVGNPYPSAIQWSNGPGWSRTNIDPTVWVWDVVGRVWHSFNANTSVGDLTNGVIASGQGFWVYAPAVGGATITINEQAKSVAGSGSYYRQAGSESVAIRASLSNNSATDNSFIVLNSNSTEGYDPSVEALKPQLGIEQLLISIVDESKAKLGHYAAKGPLSGRLPLYVHGESQGDYALSFEDVNGFPGFESLYLIDMYEEQSVALASGEAYEFTISDDPATQEDRFFLSNTPLEKQGIVSSLFRAYPNPVAGMLTIVVGNEYVDHMQMIDPSGRAAADITPVWDGRQSVAVVDMSTRSNGLYIIKAFTRNGVLIKKVIVSH